MNHHTAPCSMYSCMPKLGKGCLAKWIWVTARQQDFPGGSSGKESACNPRDLGSIPGSGRSPGGRNGNPLQNSCLENSMDRGAWWATVHGVAKCQTQLRGDGGDGCGEFLGITFCPLEILNHMNTLLTQRLNF